MTTTDKLIRMANQIAANLMHTPNPPAATAAHIDLFWDARMKALLIENGTAGLSATAAAALESIAALSAGANSALQYGRDDL